MKHLLPQQPDLNHDYPYDPTYGYTLDDLLKIHSPNPPDDFSKFWISNHLQFENAFRFIEIIDTGKTFKDLKVNKVHFKVHDEYITGAWLLLPEKVKNGLVIGHGYGGRASYDTSLILNDTAIIMPCALGFNLSKHNNIPDIASNHVLHNIEDKNNYIIKFNVMELWASAHILKNNFSTTNINYYGGSFGGGLGALALPWEPLFNKAFLAVPTFGNQPLRITMPCNGSGQAVKTYYEKHPDILEKTLLYFDAAIASQFSRVSTLFSIATFDPAVPPPGQMSVYNSWGGPKSGFAIHSGHHPTTISIEEEAAALEKIQIFFTE